MTPIGCPETSVRSRQYLLRNEPEARSSQTCSYFFSDKATFFFWNAVIFEKYATAIRTFLFMENKISNVLAVARRFALAFDLMTIYEETVEPRYLKFYAELNKVHNTLYVCRGDTFVQNLNMLFNRKVLNFFFSRTQHLFSNICIGNRFRIN